MRANTPYPMFSPPRMILAAVVLAVFSRSLLSQPADAPIAERAVRAHMDFLAGDSLHGRGSGTRDEWIAATYLASQMRAYGIEPLGDDGGYIQTVTIGRTQVVGAPRLIAGDQRLEHGVKMLVLDTDVSHAHGALHRFHPGGSVPSGSALLMPAAADPREANGLESAAIVLWRESPSMREIWKSLSQRPLTVGRTRIAGLPPADKRSSPAQILLSAAAYDAISALPDKSAVSFSADTQDVSSSTWNAVGRITGSDPKTRDQLILLSAHLDHLGERGEGPDRIYNGADDDASGSIAVLTLAQAISQRPRPTRSIVFAFFGSEELGSLGARYFLARPTVPLNSIIANLEFEMIGRSDPAVADHTLWLTGWERTDLGPALAAHGAHLVADPHPQENFFMRSDNITLAKRGVIAQTVSSYGLHAQYHQPSDDIAHIDFQHMSESIQSMLDPIIWLAGSDFVPAWRPGGRP